VPSYTNRFEAPLSHVQVQQLRDGLADWLKSQGFPGETSGRVVTVVDELFCNTMEHSGAHWADITIVNRGSGIAVAFRDDGVEFDPFVAGKHDYSLYLASDTDRRLGLYLVTRLASSVSYRRSDNVNEVDFTVAADPPDIFKRLKRQHDGK
jgi:anti-sigma regulatory factor (Ser/Thr protein kinase)